MDDVKNCTQCDNKACLEYVKRGLVPYCGGSLCRPIPKKE